MEQRTPNFKAGNVRVLVSRETVSEEEEEVEEGNGVLPFLHKHGLCIPLASDVCEWRFPWVSLAMLLWLWKAK
jgi:hypothetical protein